MNAMRQENIQKLFSGKKITIMGLGLLGRGVGDAEFFAEAGADLIVTDLKNETDLAASLARLKRFSNITYHLGEHRMEDFEDRDMIVRAPNAPLNSPFLTHAHERNIPIEMDASLFAKLTDAIIVGVTGTRGKSTTTQLIYEMAKSAGRDALLGGNVRDTSTLQLLARTNEKSIVVLELDSWQLQGFAESKISPHLAVWTNFMPDHMNYYHGDMARYFEDKAAIARFQKEGDFFITTEEIRAEIGLRFGPLRGTCITDPSIPDHWTTALPGEHNRKNAAYAIATARTLGISDEIIQTTLKEFSGLPGRLEFLGEKKGVAFYNDANSTTPEAGIAALATLAPMHRPIVLIAGGNDKEMIFDAFAAAIADVVKTLVLFEGTATEKLRRLLPASLTTTVVTTMDEALDCAIATAHTGDIILLSPGATSFGLFKNEYDRGDQFREAVEKIG